MKKVFGIILMMLLSISLIACSNQEAEQNDNQVMEESNVQAEETINEEVKETYFNVEDLNKYDMFQFIRLEENPTTGFSWTYKFDDDVIACVEDDEYVQNHSEEGIVGAGGEHTYRLSGLLEGTTIVTFKYMRPWEGEESVTKAVTFGVSVNADKQIAITSEKVEL